MAANAKKSEAPVVDCSSMSVWAKLLAVRSEFYGAGTKKSGKNTHAEFMYFELADIVPTAEGLFSKYGLLMIPTFQEDLAIAQLINVHDPAQVLTFTIPLKFIPEPGKFRMNEVQGVGAVVTYYRRYLYMIILDLVESDGIDSQKPRAEDGGAAPAPAPKPSRKAPVSTEERQDIVTELTNADGPASELQISGLKAALKQLMAMDPDQEAMVQDLAVKTKGFTELSKAKCEQLVNGVNEMLAQYGPQEG